MSPIVLNYGLQARFNFEWRFGSKTAFHGQRGMVRWMLIFGRCLKKPRPWADRLRNAVKRLAASQL